MPLPLKPDSDEDAELALDIVDGQSSDSVSSEQRSEKIEIVEQLESVRSLVRAFDSLNTGPVGRELPPPMPSWGPFVLREEVGRGGFGIVCRGFDPATDREIAVKLYRGRELPAEPRLAGQVRHPNVVTVYGAAVYDDKPGIWMEFVKGRTLADHVQSEGPLPPLEVTRVGIALCQALAAVHTAGVVHQDVKPRNVMEETGGRIVLMDFGAGLSSRERGEGANVRRFSGTPLYMAPEVVGGETPSVRSDVYSLGVLLFYLLSGTYPVYATSLQELTKLHERQRGVSARRFITGLRDLRPEVSDRLAQCVGRALAPEAERYASPAELQAALERVESGGGRRIAPGWVVVAASLSLLVLSAGVHRLSQRPALPAAPTPPPTLVAPPPPMVEPPLPVAESATGPTTTAASATFEVDAAILARRPSGDRRLRGGDRVAVGDRLLMAVSGSRPLHVYVISQDEHGSAHLLFPMADCKMHNPIPSGHHVLPGLCGGEETAWEVSSAGEREHFLVMASPIRLAQVEAKLAALSVPVRRDTEVTREVGKRVPVPEESRGSIGFRELEVLAQAETAPKTLARGVWFQEIVLENP
jgi:eukaryotic-like serine/threonine-protein kinase